MKGTPMARRFQRLALVLLALVAAPAASAHYVDLNEALHSEDTLTVGIALTGQPFAFKKDGVLRGFEVEMAQAVAEAHGLALEVVRLPRGKLAAALAAGNVDVANTLAMEEEPAGIKTVPYLVVGDHLMVLRGNPFRIREAGDLSGRVASVTSGSSAERFAHALNREFEEAGREPMHVHSFPHHRWTHFPVSMGHAQGYFIQTVSAVAISADPESRTHLLEGVFRPVREVGFAVRRATTSSITRSSTPSPPWSPPANTGAFGSPTTYRSNFRPTAKMKSDQTTLHPDATHSSPANAPFDLSLRAWASAVEL